MTFIVAAISSNAIALAADTLVQDGAGQSRADRKLFIRNNRIGILSYGCGPPGVPKAIDEARLTAQRVSEVAMELGTAFRAVVAPYRFGLYVAGFDYQTPVLYHIDIPGGVPRLENASGATGTWFAAPPGCPILESWSERVSPEISLNELTNRAVNMVHEAHMLDPNNIGSEIQSAYILTDGARWRTV
jgi:20S proteasome alpha/beta subunit